MPEGGRFGRFPVLTTHLLHTIHYLWWAVYLWFVRSTLYLPLLRALDDFPTVPARCATTGFSNSCRILPPPPRGCNACVYHTTTVLWLHGMRRTHHLHHSPTTCTRSYFTVLCTALLIHTDMVCFVGLCVCVCFLPRAFWVVWFDFLHTTTYTTLGFLLFFLPLLPTVLSSHHHHHTHKRLFDFGDFLPYTTLLWDGDFTYHLLLFLLLLHTPAYSSPSHLYTMPPTHHHTCTYHRHTTTHLSAILLGSVLTWDSTGPVVLPAHGHGTHHTWRLAFDFLVLHTHHPSPTAYTTFSSPTCASPHLVHHVCFVSVFVLGVLLHSLFTTTYAI